MAAMTAASSPRVKYAPDDPTLPKPWRGLVDNKTGYLYFWNPDTNVTQYERPVAPKESLPDETASEHHSRNNGEVIDNKGCEVTDNKDCEDADNKDREDADNKDCEDADNKGCDDADNKGSADANNEGGEDAYNEGSEDAYNEGSGDGCDKGSSGNAYNKGSYNGPEKVASEDGSCQTASGGLDYSVNNSDMKPNSASGPYASKGVETGVSAEAYRQRHEITVTGNNVPEPFMSFQITSFPSEILREIKNAGFAAPTPIQAQSWPIALQGLDIVAIAKTGSGKTLGYLIPAFLHLQQKRNNPKLGPTVLVLSPTRELATQIQDEAVKFGKSSRISCTCLYGGAPKGPQLKDLDRGVDVVVATPGRLNDILEMRRVSLHQVSYLVLDEADRMLDMGFEPQIRKIVKEVPSRRQTLMYTATWPKEVRRIASDLLVHPVQVNIGNVDELAANKAITQYVEVLQSMDKRRRVEQILRSQEPGSKIIIFCSTKKMCDMLAGNLNRPFGAAAIHGDKCQSERDHVLNQFRTGRSPVLVATDVAARGLDIKDIRVVINYDFPTGIEDYVHRIGRTGRAGASGLAYTFFSSNDERHASDLIKLLERADQKVPAELREMGSRGGGMGRPFRRWSSGSSGNDGGYGGNYNSTSSYNPSSSGRGNGTSGGWGVPSSPDQGHQQQNSRGFGSSEVNNADASGGSQYMSFHERMMAAGKNGGNPRRSPVRNSGWGENQSRERSRSPSPSVGGFGGAAAPIRRSFHETMMQQTRPSPSADNSWKPQMPSKSPSCWPDS